MKKILNNYIKPIFHRIPIVNKIFKSLLKHNWMKRSFTIIPPTPLQKQQIVKEYAEKFSMDILIETGTYTGDMVFAAKDTFNRIYSIEIDNDLYEHAKQRFSEYKYITIIKGDSSEELPKILADINQNCLFWLDGHYSGGVTSKGSFDTPIMIELKCIFEHQIYEHIILIDDARCFNGLNDYPKLKDLKNYILKKHPNWIFEVKDDIIRIYKPRI